MNEYNRMKYCTQKYHNIKKWVSIKHKGVKFISRMQHHAEPAGKWLHIISERVAPSIFSSNKTKSQWKNQNAPIIIYNERTWCYSTRWGRAQLLDAGPQECREEWGEGFRQCCQMIGWLRGSSNKPDWGSLCSLSVLPDGPANANVNVSWCDLWYGNSKRR